MCTTCVLRENRRKNKGNEKVAKEREIEKKKKQKFIPWDA